MVDPEHMAWAWVGESEFLARDLEQLRRRRKKEQTRRTAEAEDLPYQIVLSGKPIQLSQVEFRLITFLAANPYHAFRDEDIVDGVNGPGQPRIALESLGGHIQSLRQKLGFFRDYIQSVPYIGYRFKP